MSFDSKKYVDSIRNLSDLVTVINYYYPNKLKKNKMTCPFHNDKTPSFYIKENNLGQSFYKCFGCGEGGDIITFIRKMENINFIQALKKAYEILGRNLGLPRDANISKSNNSNHNFTHNNSSNNNLNYNNEENKNTSMLSKSKLMGYLVVI